jgi:phage terminase large subunit-like protein
MIWTWSLRPIAPGSSCPRPECAPTTEFETTTESERTLISNPSLDKTDAVAFLEQAAEYEAAGDVRDWLLKLMNIELETHPVSVSRAAQIRKWVDRRGRAGRRIRRRSSPPSAPSAQRH